MNLFTHDLVTALDHLGNTALEYSTEIDTALSLNDPSTSPSKVFGTPIVQERVRQLASAAIKYTAQLAVELGYDITLIRTLEEHFISVHAETAPEVTS